MDNVDAINAEVTITDYLVEDNIQLSANDHAGACLGPHQRPLSRPWTPGHELHIVQIFDFRRLASMRMA